MTPLPPMPPTMFEFQHHTEVVRAVGELRAGFPDRPLDWHCARAGVSRATYFRMKANVEKGAACVVVEKDRGGRPPKFILTAPERTALRALAMIHDSTDYAIAELARHPDCGHATREKILAEMDRAARRGLPRPAWPASLRRAAHVTLNERALWSGAKHAESVSLAPRKGMFWRDETGKDVLIKAHSAWMMDDYSTNQPYWIEVPVWENGQIVGRTIRLCRQMLVCQDVYSAAWLGVEAIGRERDAYRAEDILRFILHCVDAHETLPGCLILERGRWDSRAIHGIEVWDGHRHVTWGGLDEIIPIKHGFSSRHKAALESNLNPLQRALAHSGTDIGRTRGEFEQATKMMLKVNAGTRDAAACGFLSQPECEEMHARAMDSENRRAKDREAFDRAVVPLDLLADTMTPRPLPATERWRFLPCKREATIRRGGLIEVSVKDYPRSFIFAVNGVDESVCLENGYAVLIAFDPARPDLGCVVANGEHGTKNREGYSFGQRLMVAPVMQDAPLWDDSPRRRSGEDTDGASLKRRSSAAHRAGFREIAKVARDHRPLRVTQTLDAEGRVTRASNKRDVPLLPAGEPDTLPAATARRTRPAVDAAAVAARERRAMEEVFS